MYTDDVIHDVVGSPAGPLHGPDAARGFYDMLTQNIKTEQMDVLHAWYGPDVCVIEHQWTGTVPGEFLGIPGPRTADLIPDAARMGIHRRAHVSGERMAGRQRNRLTADISTARANHCGELIARTERPDHQTAQEDAAACWALGATPLAEAELLPKGRLWVLHAAAGELVALERYGL
jgi:hypothetical protein